MLVLVSNFNPYTTFWINEILQQCVVHENRQSTYLLVPLPVPCDLKHFLKKIQWKKCKNKQNSWHWQRLGFSFLQNSLQNVLKKLDLKASLLQKLRRGVFPFGKHWMYLSNYWKKWTDYVLIEVDSCLPPQTFQVSRTEATGQVWILILLFEDFQWSDPRCIQDQNHLSSRVLTWRQELVILLLL